MAKRATRATSREEFEAETNRRRGTKWAFIVAVYTLIMIGIIFLMVSLPNKETKTAPTRKSATTESFSTVE